MTRPPDRNFDSTHERPRLEHYRA